MVLGGGVSRSKMERIVRNITGNTAVHVTDSN